MDGNAKQSACTTSKCNLTVVDKEVHTVEMVNPVFQMISLTIDNGEKAEPVALYFKKEHTSPKSTYLLTKVIS